MARPRSEDEVTWVDTSAVQKRVTTLLQSYPPKEQLPEPVYTWRCNYLTFPSRIQSGTNCGLVAIRMVADYLRRHHVPSGIGGDLCPLSTAKSLGYTLQGEMFNSEHLAHVAQLCYGIRTKVVDNFSADDIVRHVMAGLPVAVPYDVDPTYGPGLLGGRRAHWCVIIGVAWRHGEKSGPPDLRTYADGHWPPDTHTTPLSGPSSLFLVVQQPKFVNPMVWPYPLLEASNRNLLAPCPARAGSGQYVIPKDLGMLRGKLILFYPL
eukprot:TRINITY_DN10339_c0_g1_i1.p1 TRINITY_DN10339_c0_g1~~TRINITY_DN10339_c0_g1_i1.p1  ORF type:complete len:264 (+),score=30.98 TRINITY_DN10339_c0_g1_i1:84-875(+)